MAKPHWEYLQVRRDAKVLFGRERLVALFHLLRGEMPLGTDFMDSSGKPIYHASLVDWANFPLDEAGHQPDGTFVAETDPQKRGK